MPETICEVNGVYTKVTGTPEYIELMPARRQPPMTASTAGDAPPPIRRPRPNGRPHTTLVVLLYGWSYPDVPHSAARLLKSCGAGKLPFWFSSDAAPLSNVRDHVNAFRNVTSALIRHSYFSCSERYSDLPPSNGYVMSANC